LLASEAVKVRAGMPVLVEGWGGDKALRAWVWLVEPFAMTKVSALGIEEKRTNVIADFVDPPGLLGDGYRSRPGSSLGKSTWR
jgi:HlyD family secretion protein